MAKLWVDVGVNNSGLSKGLGKVKGALSGLAGNLMGAASGFGGALVGAFAIKEVVGQFIEGEQATVALSSSLATSGQEVDANMAKFSALAGELEQFTRQGDEATFGLLTMATNMGIPASEAGNLSKAAVGLSQALGIDAGAAMQMLSKESLGMKSKLDKSIPSLKGVSDQTERLRIITDMAQKGMAQEQAMAGTLGGRLSQLWNQVGNLAESIGGLLAPAIMFGVDLLQTWMGILQGVMDHFSGAGVSMKSFGELIKLYFVTVWSSVARVVMVAGDAIIAVCTPIGEAINTISGFILETYERAMAFGMRIPEMWQQMAESINGIFQQIGATFSWLTGTMSNSIGSGTENVMRFIDDMVFTFMNMDLVVQEVGITLANWGYAISDTFNWVTEVVSGFGAWFYQNFQEIWPTVLDYALTALINWGTNIRTVFAEVFNYLKSGFSDPIDLTGLKKTTEGANNYMKKGFEMPKMKDSFDADAARAEVATEWGVRRKEWDSIVTAQPLTDPGVVIDPLKVVKEAQTKDKKGTSGESGQFSALGSAFKSASTNYQKEQDKMAKEALRLQKRQIELQEREVEALENLSVGLE